MEMVLSSNFCEMNMEETALINGGSGVDAAQGFFGAMLIGHTPAVTVGAIIVGGPLSGIIAAGACLGFGLSLLGAATH